MKYSKKRGNARIILRVAAKSTAFYKVRGYLAHYASMWDKHREKMLWSASQLEGFDFPVTQYMEPSEAEALCKKFQRRKSRITDVGIGKSEQA